MMHDRTQDQEFVEVYPVYIGWIREFAVRLAQGDQDLVDDLVQTGRVALWKLCEEPEPDGTARHPRRNVGYRRRAITYQMLGFLRRERRLAGTPRKTKACVPGARRYGRMAVRKRMDVVGRHADAECRCLAAECGWGMLECKEECLLYGKRRAE